MRSIPAMMVDGAEALTRAVPRSLALSCGRRLGDLTALLARSRRRTALANLEMALAGQHDSAARRRIMQRSFQRFGENLIEALLLPRMAARGLERHVDHEGWQHLERAVAGGRGAIIFTGHFGNWELVALAQGARGIPMDVVGRPLDDAALGRRLRRLRQLTGNRMISKREAVRPMFRSLRQGRTVGLVVDQNVNDPRSSLFVDFFGRLAATTPALGVLAVKTGVPVLPVFGYPSRGRHRVVYGAPLEITSTGNRRDDIMAWTVAASRTIEAHVRQHPELWLWMHNRWRTRPLQGTPAERP